MGGGVILTQFFTEHQIGAASFLGLFITACVVTSILLDDFGGVEFEQHFAGIWRVIGAIVRIGRVALIDIV
jgi:transporter family-2 protein